MTGRDKAKVVEKFLSEGVVHYVKSGMVTGCGLVSDYPPGRWIVRRDLPHCDLCRQDRVAAGMMKGRLKGYTWL